MSKCSGRVIIVRDNNRFHSSSGLLESSPMNFDIVVMSNLIRTWRAMTSTPSSTTTPTNAATAPAEMDHRPVNPVDPVALDVLIGAPRTTDQMSPLGSTIDASGTWPAKKNTRGPYRQLKMAKVTWVTNGRIPIRYDERHRAAPTTEQHSALAHDIGHVVQIFCHMWWKSWKAMSEETKNTTNYNLEDKDEDMFTYLNRLFSERYKHWKSDLHQCFQQFDDLQVALEKGCPKKWEDP
ncbi:unnamed protein product [Malus baccata var. baccata]